VFYIFRNCVLFEVSFCYFSVFVTGIVKFVYLYVDVMGKVQALNKYIYSCRTLHNNSTELQSGVNRFILYSTFNVKGDLFM